MAKMTRADRVAAAQKGARTKAKRAALANAIGVQSLIDKGLSVHQIALFTDQTTKDVLDALKLLSLVPIPGVQQIGVAAHGIGIGQDLVDTLNLTKKTGKIPPQIPSSTGLPHLLQPFIDTVMNHPEQVRGDIITTLNNIGRTFTQPVANAEDFLRKLATGQP